MNFVTGNATRSVSVAARLKRTRFFAHGACALAAWFCFGFGTLVSAFFKTVHVPFFRNQNETTIKRRWFVAHVASQTCGALLAVAALAVALRESKGETGSAFDWARSDASDQKKAHGACGVALVFCVAAQIALGAFREAKRADADGDFLLSADDIVAPRSLASRTVSRSFCVRGKQTIVDRNEKGLQV